MLQSSGEPVPSLDEMLETRCTHAHTEEEFRALRRDVKEMWPVGAGAHLTDEERATITSWDTKLLYMILNQRPGASTKKITYGR